MPPRQRQRRRREDDGAAAEQDDEERHEDAEHQRAKGEAEVHALLPEELRPFRPLPIRLLNAANLALARLFGVDLIPLDADAMLDSACARLVAERGAGTECDFGDAEYGSLREGLGVFVRALREEAELTLIGRTWATHRIASLLDQRLRLVAYWRSEEHGAAVARTQVTAPLFVVGLPRTSTSFLHTLLAQDSENFRSPLNWMVVDPGPPPLFGSIDDDPESPVDGEPEPLAAVRRARIAEASSNLAQFKAIAPGLDAQHTMTASRPEECIVFQAHTMVAWEFITYFRAPSFAAWLRDRPDYSDCFRWHHQMLRHLGSATPPDSADKTWVLKTPFYTAMLEDLVAEYPDARVVMTHRRPVKSMASLSSLQMKLRSVSSDHADPTAIADEVAPLWDAFAARAVSVREAWERDPSAGPGGGLVDVELGQLHTAPMEAVGAIYEALGLKLSEAAEAKMRRWLADNGREKHGKNRYKAEWFDAGGMMARHEGLRKYDDWLCAKFPDACGSAPA